MLVGVAVGVWVDGSQLIPQLLNLSSSCCRSASHEKQLSEQSVHAGEVGQGIWVGQANCCVGSSACRWPQASFGVRKVESSEDTAASTSKEGALKRKLAGALNDLESYLHPTSSNPSMRIPQPPSP